MSPLLSRILLAILMLPLAATLYFIIAICLFEWSPWRFSRQISFGVANTITFLFVDFYWIMLWRNLIRWHRTRVVETLAVTGISIIIGLAVGGLLGKIATDLGWFIWGPVAISLWLPGTVLVWRETPAERADRIRRVSRDAITCPRCGYNMTGLRESKCPECGSSYTINELLAGQPGQSSRELEAE